VAAADADRPLISKLLAVPEFRTRYLQYVRELADKWLDWNRLGPIAAHYHELIAEAVEADTRKLASTAAFRQSVDGTAAAGGGRGPGASVSLRSFAEQRRAFLLAGNGAKVPVKQVVAAQRNTQGGTRQ
jgi:hypothetical protein